MPLMLPLAFDLATVGARLAVDLLAIAALAFGLSYRRHRRSDLVALYVCFNVGLFAAVIVIADGDVAAAVGFGLFAVLSIIRLRAETLTNPEIAYFFAAVVLGLVCAVDIGGVGGNALLAALVLAAPAIVDHPRLLRHNHHVEVTLDRAISDPAELAQVVGRQVGGEVIAVEVTQIDLVRETTRVAARVLR